MTCRRSIPLVLVAAATMTCRPAPAPTRPTRPAASARPSDSAVDASAPATAAANASASTAQPEDDPPPLEPPRVTPLESVCDGQDEDNDGHVDLLLPTGANACMADARGACAHGWLECRRGQAVCDAPPPSPEVFDGIDNDCNGIVDDVRPAKVHPRALILGPEYMWKDAQSEVASVVTALEQAGVPYDSQEPGTGWSAGGSTAFARYSLLVIPGYLESDAIDDEMRATIEGFASGGGVVIVMKPMASVKQANALALAGIRAAARTRRATSLGIVSASAPALGAFNSREERIVPLTTDTQRAPMDVWIFQTQEKTEVLAEAYAGAVSLGAVATRRPLGRGAIYAWGHDLSTFDASRCYTNCFEPSGDLLRLVLREALREGAQGHVILKHTIPGAADSALLVTHDVGGRDGYRAGPWGEPGALQMAAMERRNGVRATYNFTTDYIDGSFAPQVVQKLCDQGFCPGGAASVRHLTNFAKLPRGTCAEVRETYGAAAQPSVCGEVRVSLDILTKITHERPHAWRSPHLGTNPFLFDVLAQNGVTLDSSFGVGDLKYNLPVDTAHTPKLKRLFHGRPLFEFPITGTDEGTSSEHAEDLDTRGIAWFESAWEYAMLRNAENSSITTLLVHPTQDIDAKIDALQHVIRVAQAHRFVVGPLVEFGDFWRARAKVTFDAEYDPQTGYTGFFQVGEEPVRGLTFEFGDAIASVDCAACGTVEIHGKRVVMRDKLAAGTHASFVAVPRSALPPTATSSEARNAPVLNARVPPGSESRNAPVLDAGAPRE